jgi:integrase
MPIVATYLRLRNSERSVKAKLTKRTVESVRPNAASQLVWDTDIKGFGCKITPKGKRVYFLYYRTADSRERRPAIGVHGAITCEQARVKAQRWLGEIAAGQDPSEEKQRQRKSATMQELCVQFMEEHGRRRLKRLTAVTYQGIIDNHIVPLCGKLKIDRVSQSDVERVMRSVEDGHTSRIVRLGKQRWSKVRGGKGVANRTVAVLSKMFNFAESRDLRARGTNPARHVQKNPETSRERFLSNREYQRLAQTLATLERSGVEDYRVTAILRLLLYTGLRRSELVTLQWSFVDFEDRCLRLPDTKTGRKVTYLSDHSIALLEAQPRREGNPYVFPGDVEGGHFIAIEKAWHRVRKLAGLTDVTLHDLRRSWGSIGARGGMSLLLIGKAMGHKTTKATEIYARVSDDAKRDATEAIASLVAALAASVPDVEQNG